MRVGISLTGNYPDVADPRQGARWMIERAAAARRTGLDSLFIGDNGQCEQRPYKTRRKKSIPLDGCISDIANFCDCRVWREKSHLGNARHVFFGLRPDIEVAHYLPELIDNAVRAELGRCKNSAGYRDLSAPDHVLGVNIASRPDWGELNTSTGPTRVPLQGRPDGCVRKGVFERQTSAFSASVAIGDAGRTDRHVASALGCGPVARSLTSAQPSSRKAYRGE